MAVSLLLALVVSMNPAIQMSEQIAVVSPGPWPLAVSIAATTAAVTTAAEKR